MNILANFEFTDFNELNEYQLLNAIKDICEFDNVREPYLIDIAAKSFSYEKRTITYSINIYDLDTGV